MKPENKANTIPPAELPEDVKQALAAGRKVEAVKLLRRSRALGLKEAVDTIALYQGDEMHDAARVARPAPARKQWNARETILYVGCFLSFIWMMVNIFVLTASLIILFNLDGYREEEFRVTRVYYRSEGDGGVQWGLYGLVDGTERRLADRSLLPGTKDVSRELSRRYPAGTTLRVWYNPSVTKELFQDRSVNVIPYTEDPAAEEQRRIENWALVCLLPFLGFLAAALVNKKSLTTVERRL